MKKRLTLISVILVAVLCLSLFTACSGISDEYLQIMIDSIKDKYQNGISGSFVTSESYSLPGIASYYDAENDKDYECYIQWSTNVEAITVSERDENDYVTINIPILDAQTKYTLTATLVNEKGKAYDAEKYSYSIELTATATSTADKGLMAYEAKVVSNPVAGTAYKLGVYNVTLNKMLYFSGTTGSNQYCLGTTEDFAQAADVYLETMTGGYRLYFMDGSNKKYVELTYYANTASGYSSASMNISATASADAAPLVIDDATKTLKATINYTNHTGAAATGGAYFGTRTQKYPTDIRSLNTDYLANGKWEEVERPACLLSGKVELPQATAMTQEEIITAAKALQDGESIPTVVSLTGAITEHTYSDSYKNSEGIIKVTDDFSIKYYRMNGGETLAVGDTITVTGVVKNYQGVIEFDAGCTYVLGAAGSGSGTGSGSGSSSAVDPDSIDVGTAQVGDNTVTLTDGTNRKAFSTECMVYGANGVKIIVDKASASSPHRDQVDKGDVSLRCYQGTTVTIQCQNMTKIVIVCDDYTYEGKTYYSGFDGMEIAGATITRDGVTITIVFDAPVNEFVSLNLGSQTRIESITVTVADASAAA